MKKTICLTISLLYSILLCANNLNGEYINDSGCKILISGSTMYYIERQDHNPLWYNDTKRFSFSIEPTLKRPIHTVEGQSYGIVCLAPIPINIEPSTNKIYISLPTLDNHFFEKYYIKSDYVYYDENIIKWKGNIYVKRKK